MAIVKFYPSSNPADAIRLRKTGFVILNAENLDINNKESLLCVIYKII